MTRIEIGKVDYVMTRESSGNLTYMVSVQKIPTPLDSVPVIWSDSGRARSPRDARRKIATFIAECLIR